MSKSDNLALYNRFKEVDKTAKKKITGGRLNGFTNINPMWRIKMLTEEFGQCGVGWKFDILDQRTISIDNGEVCVFVDINLFYRIDAENWSEPVKGIGGSKLVSKEKNGLYTDDECFKKALTDAISVAGKSLGLGADVYFEGDVTKYDEPPKQGLTAKSKVSEEMLDVLAQWEEKGKDRKEITNFYKVKDVKDLTNEEVAAFFEKWQKQQGGAFNDL